MGLILPTHVDYTESAEKLKTFFSENNLHYCVYGSFIVPGKIRHGLSDIDAIAVSDTPQLTFPIGITRAFGKVKQAITELGVPTQINFITLGQWNSPLHTVDGGYLEEVKKGLSGIFYSSKVSAILGSRESQRDEKDDDKNMMRYFHRKIQELGTHILDIERVVAKDKVQITLDDQHKLFQFWDVFKKMVTYVGSAIRVKSGMSVFHLKDRELFAEFSRNFGTPEDNQYMIDSYLRILESIRNIDDWFNFLKNGGIEEVIHIYTHLFALMFSKTSEHLND